MEEIAIQRGIEVKIPLNTAKKIIIQNISSAPLKWAIEPNSTSKFILSGKDTIIVDYDVYFSSNRIGTKYLTVGRIM